ncbi:MAG TPA: hypothetical protein VGR70_08630 [Stellaceae bacterium]|nr:hypothetical protein [Stellaceae bacterium]
MQEISAGDKKIGLLRLKYQPSRAAIARLAGICLLGAAALYLIVSRSTQWDRFFELALGFAIAVYVTAVVNGRLRSAALTIASLLFCLAAAELYALRQSAPAIDITTPGFSGTRPHLGWGPQHAGVFHQKKIDARTGNVIYDAAYTIDANLNRQVISSATGPTIAFFGDSMTFGQGVADADTLPQAFADATGREYRVLNFGIPGYGPQQFLRALETGMYRDLLSGSRLFVTLTAPWHAERTNCGEGFMWHAPRYVLSHGALAYEGRCKDHWTEHVRQLWTRTAIDRVFLKPAFGGANAADIDLYVAILIRAGQLAREKYAAPTLILYLPGGDYLRRAGTTDEQIMQRLRDAGLLVVDANLDAKDFPGQNLEIPGDGHPTGVANRALAPLVRDVIAGLPPETR